MFEIVTKAGLTQEELAFLCAVSRVTANKWMNERSKPHALIRKRVKNVLAKLAAVLAAGALPLPEGAERIVAQREGAKYSIRQDLIALFKSA